MTLSTLQRYDSATAANIIAAAMLTLRPGEAEVGLSVVSEYADQANELLLEIQDSIKLKPDDRRNRGMAAAVTERLSHELDGRLLNDKTRLSALARAGQAGRLPTSLYKVIQPAHFRGRFGPLGVRKEDVVKTVGSPSDVQHLLTDDVVPEARETHSIFMRSFRPDRKGLEPYWLLIVTHRQGVEQTAQSAWRVYPTDVDLSRAETPAEVLRAFVEQFGLQVCVNGRCSKFVLSQKADIDSFQVTWEMPPNVEFFASFGHSRGADLKSTHVGLAFCINMTKYAAMLHQKGVK